MYGDQIGKKFGPDGTAAPYPGNTVIADVRPGNPGYEMMNLCRKKVLEAGLSGLFILLPEDSYHMTVIRGLNDLVRAPEYWPAALSAQATMEEADAYVERAVNAVPPPNGFSMRFVRAAITAEDFRVCLQPATEETAQSLTEYRDRVAKALGLFLPGHQAYTCHITLAYTWRLPSPGQKKTLNALAEEMNALLKAQPPFFVERPHAAYYQDMLEFSPVKLERRRER